MRILLTNDDGIYAPGLAAMERALRRLGEVYVVAPSKEQSGVSHSITFLTPLSVKNVYVDDQQWGWTVDGSPADCVKLAVSEILPEMPDLIVSGMNGGLNAGINILYSGTVAAAAEGSFYGITSFAVSLEYDENEPFHVAADLAVELIGKVLEKEESKGRLFNLNIPLAALSKEKPEVRVVGMDVSHYWESFERRTDPLGRSYYWLTGRPNPRRPRETPEDYETDLQAISAGQVTLTPLKFDVTHRPRLEEMRSWDLSLEQGDRSMKLPAENGPSIRTTMNRFPVDD